MYNPIKNMKFSQTSLEAIARIQWQLEMSKIALYFISVGHVYSLILGNSGHASRVINISLAEWDEYQQTSNWGGLSGARIHTVNAVISNHACLVSMRVSDPQEIEFWKSIAGDRCKV